jgi:hypothetical protein
MILSVMVKIKLIHSYRQSKYKKINCQIDVRLDFSQVIELSSNEKFQILS